MGTQNSQRANILLAILPTKPNRSTLYVRMLAASHKLNLVKGWLFAHPFPRAAMPAVLGAVLGLQTNILSSAIYKDDQAQWHLLLRESSFWWGIVFLAAGIWYQERIYRHDNRTGNVLDASKEELAGSIAQFYRSKIDAGQIDELAEADKKLRKVFQSHS